MLDRIGDQRLQLLGKGTWVKAVAAKADDGTIQVVLANFDQYSNHSEDVPITFQNIVPGQYTVTAEYLGGQKQVNLVATSEATLRVQVPMPVNTVSFVQLSPPPPSAPAQ